MDIYAYLSKFDRVTKDPSLNTMNWIMNEFDNPHKKNRFIHVAGTNGKGSTCEMITNVLINAGYKVGKFISPYLTCFNESITINNKYITDEELEEVLIPLAKKIDEYKKEHEVKWFEITSSIAIIYFAKQNCDFVVIETGLGGVNDCTNIVDSEISIITSIGYDHMDILGNTIEEIATHKAGIIKENSDCICPKNINGISVIEDVCKQKNTKLHLVERKNIRNITIYNNKTQFDYKDLKRISINLKGLKQIDNACICIECIKILQNKGISIEDKNILNGLKCITHPGRFEVLLKSPTIIFDGGHNDQAISNLIETMKTYYPNNDKCYIFSILRTKDYKSVLSKLLEDKKAVFIFTDGNDKNRYVPKEELYNMALNYDKNKARFYKCELKQAIKKVCTEYKNKVIGIIGSFYIYKDVKDELNSMRKEND